MNRLNSLNHHFRPKGNFSNNWDYMNCDQFLTAEGKNMKDKTEEYMKLITHSMYDNTETAEFPFHVMDGIAKLGIVKADMPIEVGGRGMNVMDSGAIMYELARGDASIATFYLLHHSLG